jgi:HK97 family phage portal protein
MAWYDVFTRANPAQPIIARSEGMDVASREDTTSYQKFYEELEIVNRAVNMIVDDVSEIRVKVGDNLGVIGSTNIKKVTLEKLLNVQPNPYQDVNAFYRNLVIDLIIDGNIFVYFDGAHMYHLPASKMVITPDTKAYVAGYVYDGMVNYDPSEIIHIKENSFYSIYRGVPRLKACLRTMKLLKSMRTFQDNFFKNGAIPGLVIKSPNTLSDKIKDRMLQAWGNRYNPTAGGRRPLILDGGMELEDISKINFKDLDFQSSITANEETILKSLGVPPILLNSGNNANLRPNHRLYYLETIIPITKKLNSAFERFFGFKVTADVVNIPALQPELAEQANYLSSLKNGGIISADEARADIGKDPKGGEHGELVVPANVAGSAANPSTGGRPKDPKDDKNKTN